MKSRKLQPLNEIFIHLQYLFKFGTRPNDPRSKPCVSLYCVPLSGCCNFFSFLHVVNLNLGSHVCTIAGLVSQKPTTACASWRILPAPQLVHQHAPVYCHTWRFHLVWPRSNFGPLSLSTYYTSLLYLVHAFPFPFYIFVILCHYTTYA